MNESGYKNMQTFERERHSLTSSAEALILGHQLLAALLNKNKPQYHNTAQLLLYFFLEIKLIWRNKWEKEDLHDFKKDRQT